MRRKWLAALLAALILSGCGNTAPGGGAGSSAGSGVSTPAGSGDAAGSEALSGDPEGIPAESGDGAGSEAPELTEEDFYALELGSAGLMRGYMVRPCDGTLTLEKKLRMFLTLSLRGYKVPEEEVRQILRFVEGLDIRTVAEQVMQKLFQALAMHYEFSLSEEAQAAATAAPEDKEKKTKL